MATFCKHPELALLQKIGEDSGIPICGARWVSCGLDFDLLSDDYDCIRERTGSEAERSFYNSGFAIKPKPF